MNPASTFTGTGLSLGDDVISLIERSPVGITITRNGILTYANHTALAIFGYADSAALVGRSALDLVAPEHWAWASDRLQRRMRGEDMPRSYDYVALRQDGSRADVHIEVARLALSDGPAIIGYHMDVSAQRQGERALRESEDRFRNMAEHAPIIMRVTDSAGACVYMNRLWYQFTGRTEPRSRGDGWINAIHPDEAANVRNSLARFGEQQAAYQLEYRLARADGSYCWVLDSAAPRFDDAHGFLGFIASVVDINDRRQAEIANGQLAAIVESSDDAIISKTLDGTGTVVSWNAAATRIFGYTSAEMVGASIFRLIPPELHEEEHMVFAQVVRGDPVQRMETERIRKDGKRIQIELTVSPMRDRAGRIVGAASIKRDVTQRRRTEQRLRQSAKMEAIGRLAGGLAHDFNNQLHALRGFAEFAASDPGLGAAAREDLVQVQRAAERMASLTRQLLAFSRRQILAPQTIDLGVSIVEMQPMLQRLIGSDIEMSIECSPGQNWVSVDPAQLLQVIMNLAINARDAMPGGGRLLMWTGTRQVASGDVALPDDCTIEAGEYAVLRVQDSGVGVAPEHLGQIFEPFFTTKDVGEGTGLGLSTVQGIVSQSCGAILVQSIVGSGTTFTILLPLAAPPTPTPTPTPIPSRAPVTRRRTMCTAQLLVVDDEALVREVAKRALESVGFQVHFARHGAEALEILNAVDSIDLVISDVVMPVMGGVELGRQLAISHADLPLIWVSGHPREALSELLGTDDYIYLQKPVMPEVLVATVEQVLSSAGLDRVDR